ncbi:sperm acrosome membrane-associated protein 3-like [Tachyglossus aculeatus]|uniref:sperm acrosome membrane-associated protein 3-like n=1 Tax=Tachyglossus aculeatus TaxID=9261 RepID=UPI0018F282F4|nr:sperm acrosome membrane-associated protein 3-like [Tachyglossus aculeatus]
MKALAVPVPQGSELRALGLMLTPWNVVPVLLLWAGCLLATSEAKIYSRCELARTLQEGGLGGYRGYQVADWVCLAYYESGFDSGLEDHEIDGSTNNGIFQINSRLWCLGYQDPGANRCHLHCSDLLTANIKDDIVCAMKIVQAHRGLEAWSAWKTNCEGKDLASWVEGCDL